MVASLIQWTESLHRVHQLPFHCAQGETWNWLRRAETMCTIHNATFRIVTCNIRDFHHVPPWPAWCTIHSSEYQAHKTDISSFGP
jgi:hypothetical protein